MPTEYKIYKIYNNQHDYYISYTKQKYLSSVMENFRRKETDTFVRLFGLFNVKNAKIELLEIVESENVYFIKNKVNDYIVKEDEKHNVKNKSTKNKSVKRVEVEAVAEAEVEAEVEPIVEPVVVEPVVEATTEKVIECDVCKCKVSYANFARHRKSKKHLSNIN